MNKLTKQKQELTWIITIIIVSIGIIAIPYYSLKKLPKTETKEKVQQLQDQAKELKTEIDKINKDFEEVRNNYKNLNLSKETNDFVYNKTGFNIKQLVDNLQPIEDIGFQNYDGSYFLTLSEGQKRELIEIYERKIKAILHQAKEGLENILGYLEQVAEWVKKDYIDIFYGTDILYGYDIKRKFMKHKFSIIWSRRKFENLDQKSIAEKIKAVKEAYQELEKINWKKWISIY
ncbi:hypothetical protein [endosymbiont GvMRE of Glomus versiforme]|uniref:hypothetical protein n=1 Tax=endosymbiont GvMRE of Glomus versiforme TaxID=2039283 RepID=UPI0011C3AF0D|nr:hypothetical protein [endosymbiont GvMRE of Glomus versiforme]